MGRYKRYHKRNKRSLAARARENKLKPPQQPVEETSDEIFNRLLQESRTYPGNKSPPDDYEDKENNANKMDVSYDEESELPDLLIERCSEPKQLDVTGRRVVDINHMLIQLQKLSTHHRECTMGKFEFNREVVSGLFSKFIYYCDNCETEVAVTSEPDDRRQDVNDAAVWGGLAIGVGHSQVQELFGVLDVPFMGPQKFRMH